VYKRQIVFGALDIYHHAALKPAAAKWRAALFAARDSRAMPVLPPESAVHLKTWNFANPSEARNAGYRRIGDEYVRIDLAERVIKKAHEARGQNNAFGMDMAFATSLGISEAGLKALMRDAGFRPAEAAVVNEAAADETPVVEEVTPAEATPAPEVEAAAETAVADADAVAPEQTAPKEIAPVVLTHWRWVGLPKPRPPEQRRPHASAERKPHASAKPKAKPDRAPPAPKPSAPPSALALQLAALKGLKL
jgi:ATP-dependent RNA helicase SUPV3L1/SUV3